jgi:hypothetical protein
VAGGEVFDGLISLDDYKQARESNGNQRYTRNGVRVVDDFLCFDGWEQLIFGASKVISVLRSLAACLLQVPVKQRAGATVI